MLSKSSLRICSNIAFSSVLSLTASLACSAAPAPNSDQAGFESAAKIRELTAEIKKNPRASNPYVRRGLFFSQAEEEEKALDDFNKAIEYDPNNPEAYFCRGDLYVKMDKYGQARIDYLKSADLIKEPAVKGLAYQQAGKSAYRTGNLAESLKLLDKAVAMVDEKRKAPVLINRAETHLALKQYAATVADIDAVPVKTLGEVGQLESHCAHGVEQI